jgi:hypothetical protein
MGLITIKRRICCSQFRIGCVCQGNRCSNSRFSPKTSIKLIAFCPE